MSVELLEVGTEVRMSAVGKIMYRDAANNPYNLVGRITDNDRNSAHIYAVEWENTYRNQYRVGEIEPIDPTEEKEITFKDLLMGEISKRVADSENAIRNAESQIERLENIAKSFQVLTLGADDLQIGDLFIYVTEEGDICVETSDTAQLHPDRDGDYSIDGGYLPKDLIKVVIRAEGLTEHMLTTEMLEQLVTEHAKEVVKLSPEAVKVLRDFGGTSAVDFINKIRKTRNTDLTKVMEALDELLK